MKLSKYLNSVFIDNDGTVNNLTLDRQNNGQLHAMRNAVSKGVTDPATKTITEEAFFKCRKMYLDTILRQIRSVSDNDGNFALDNTSEAHGVSPGRHLAADALLFSEVRSHFGDVSRILEEKLFEEFGSMYETYDSAKLFDENTNSSAAIEPWLGWKFFPTAYPDRKFSMKKFAGMNDMSALKILEDWD